MKVDSLNLLSEDLLVRLGDAWKSWHTGFGTWVKYASIFGGLWALLRFRKISRHSITTLGLGLLWIAATLVIQMVVGWTRIWFFLSPIYFIYAIAGWVDLLDLLGKRISKNAPAWLSAAIVLVVILFGSGRWWFTSSRFQQQMNGSKGYSQMAAEFIAEFSQPTDLILVTSPEPPMLWYYASQVGIVMERFNPDSEIPFSDALLVINTAEGQTINQLLAMKNLQAASTHEFELIYAAHPIEIYTTPISNLSP